MAHACLERFYGPVGTAHFDWHERLRLTTHNHNWVRVRPMKHKQIAELAAVAGVSFWEMDGKVLCHDQMQSMYAWIKKNEERLKYTWNLGDHKWARRGGEFRATKNPEHLKLQRLLERWGGVHAEESETDPETSDRTNSAPEGHRREVSGLVGYIRAD